MIAAPPPHGDVLTPSPSLGCSWIRLLPISEREWRISDGRIPFGDAGSVLGFAELVGADRYEVLRLGHGHGVVHQSFNSLDEVVDYFAQLS